MAGSLPSAKKATVYFCGYHQHIHQVGIRGSFFEKVCVCVCVCGVGGGGVKQLPSLSQPITSTYIGSRSRICRTLSPGQIHHTTMAVYRRVRQIARSYYQLRHVCVCLSVCPSVTSVRTEQFGSHWTDFHEIWYITFFFGNLSWKFKFR